MKRINVWIKDYQYEILNKMARKTKDKVAEHIRRAIDDYIRKEKGK